MTEPPPIANKYVKPSSFTRATALINVSYVGFASIPPNSSHSRFPNACTAHSKAPFRLTEPPPYKINTFASFGISPSISLIRSFPNKIFVGFLNVKLRIPNSIVSPTFLFDDIKL